MSTLVTGAPFRPRGRHRVRTSERLQLAANEAGATALGIVLARFGRWVGLPELRQACDAGRDGSTIERISDAAREFGLDADVVFAEPADLVELPLPVILNWRFSHFVVLEGWSRGNWLINDPAHGRSVCSPHELDLAFTGQVLTAVPGPQFERGGEQPSTMRRLRSRLVGSRDGVVLMAIIGLLLIVPDLLVPGLSELFVDAYSQRATIDATAVIGALVAAAILQATLIGLQSDVGLRMATKVNVVLSSALMDRLLRLPTSYYDTHGASELADRAGQPKAIARTVSSLFSTLTVAVIGTVSASIVLLWLYPLVGLVALTTLGLIVLTRRLAQRQRTTLAQRIVRDQSEVAIVTTVALSQIEVVKANGAEDAMIARWNRAHERLLASTQALGDRASVVSYLPRAISRLGGVAVTLTGLAAVATGALSAGGLAAVQTLNGLVLGSIPIALAQLEQAQSLRGQLDQIDDVLDSPPDPQLAVSAAADPATAHERIRGELRMTGIEFGYHRSQPPVISGLELHLTPGRRIALVGASGCGKSTAAKLAVGSYEPWQGEVLLDGRPLREWPQSVLASYVAVVEQDPVIFAGTIRDNITMWNPTIPETDMIQAAKDACLHEDIVSRPGAYAAEVAEFGTDLSGGQRQRLEIARALVRNPSLLILDEATSALDAATEASVDHAIRRRGVAALVIAHRLSTIRDCDEIIVLDHGHVVERGSHDELLARDGAYATLVRT